MGESVAEHDADLRAGIEDLSGLLAGSLGLSELLAQVAAFTCRAIPGADVPGSPAVVATTPCPLCAARSSSVTPVTAP